MQTIGITGGIGSGKTIVCSVFKSLGIPVFYADTEAKNLYQSEPGMVEMVRSLFGNGVISGNEVDKKALADLVFNNEEDLSRLNSLIHPLVRQKFITWAAHQDAPYVIHEAAILIESGAYRHCNSIIQVTADVRTRVERVMKRSTLSEEEIFLRMSKQMTEEERRPFCKFEVHNDPGDMILPQIIEIHHGILKVSGMEII